MGLNGVGGLITVRGVHWVALTPPLPLLPNDAVFHSKQKVSEESSSALGRQALNEDDGPMMMDRPSDHEMMG